MSKEIYKLFHRNVRLGAFERRFSGDRHESAYREVCQEVDALIRGPGRREYIAFLRRVEGIVASSFYEKEKKRINAGEIKDPILRRRNALFSIYNKCSKICRSEQEGQREDE